MSQPPSVLHGVIHPKPPGSGMVMRPLAGKQPETAFGEPEDFDLVLSVLVENAPVAMALFDERMRYVLANRQWINDFGLQQSLPLVGHSQYDVFPNLHPGWRSVYERALQGHVVRSEHDVMPGPQGRAMIFRWEVRPWRRSKDNSVGGVMVTCEKFAGLTTALEGVEGAEPDADPAPVQPTLPESDIPLLIVNVQGLILQANRAAGALALARGIQEGTSYFWEAFAEETAVATVRLDALAVLSNVARETTPLIGGLATRLATGEAAAQRVIKWSLSLLADGADDAVEQPRFLLVGLPGEESIPPPVVVPPPPAATPMPPPMVSMVDPALQLENRRLEAQLSGAAKELRVLQEMEHAYKRRELRQREVLDALPCGLIVLDERGRPTFHNAHVRSLFGCDLKPGDTVEAWLTQACLDESHRSEVSTIWRESVWRRQLTKIVSLNTADGLVKDLEFRPTPLGNGGLLLTIHDVTDTCRLEEMLRSMEAKFRAVLHESPVAAVLTDVTGSIFDANGAAERLLGHPKAELRRMGIDDWLSAESVQLRRGEMQRMAASHQMHASMKVEVLANRNADPQRAELRLAAVYDPDGRLHSTVHYLQLEPTPRVETIPLLVPITAAAVPSVAPAVEPVAVEEHPSAPPITALLCTDTHGRIRSWEPAAEALFGFAPSEALGKPLYSLFRPSDPSGFMAETQEHLAAPRSSVTLRWFGHGRKGLDTFLFDRHDDEGGLAMTLLLDGVDAEPSRAVQSLPTPEEPKASRTYVIGPSVTHPWPVADLEREQLMLTEAHHRIKNHLQIISSLLNLQSNTLEDAGARQALRSSQNRVRAIAALHEHLYQLSLGVDMSLQDFTDGLVSRLRDCYDAPASRVSVSVTLDACEVRDEWQMPLALILNEALSNAFKHAFPEGRTGTIQVRLTTQNQEAHLTIEDDGVGLGLDFDGSINSGLGMKVIGVFAEQMKGKVNMENITDGGVIFDLRFPIGCVDI